MQEIARKLQYKENFRCLVLECPEGLQWGFPFDEARVEDRYDLEVMFTQSMDNLLESLPGFIGNGDDRIRWISYPKKSGSISSDLSRDNIWEELKIREFQPVSMISLNDDWSAMRIRSNSHVKNMPKEDTSMPADLAALLAAHPECHDYFKSLSNTNQKEYIKWIANAKKEDTRKKRLEKTRSLLRDKIPNPYSAR